MLTENYWSTENLRGKSTNFIQVFLQVKKLTQTMIMIIILLSVT